MSPAAWIARRPTVAVPFAAVAVLVGGCGLLPSEKITGHRGGTLTVLNTGEAGTADPGLLVAVLRGHRPDPADALLVALARAMLPDPRVLLLDEATASVDVATEARMQRALDAAMADRTALVIAHRLSTVRAADRIVVLEAGRIVEEGTHDELAARGGRYAELLAAHV